MKVVNIVPGFGGTFYCGNCLRDSGMTEALQQLGAEAHTLPIYLPLFTDNIKTATDTPVFYGAVNIYLKQNFGFLRKMPSWLYRFFNSPFFLRYAAGKAGSTRTHGLEEMTLSMLRGHEGYQQDELEMLIAYLRDHEKPDVVHLSNALLLGLAYKIKTELGVPVVCSLQDEDVWVDAMQGQYRQKVWDMMSEKGKDVDAFIAVSDFFAGVMAQKMQIPPEKLHTIYVGIDSSKYFYHKPEAEMPVIGYLSRMNHENGFGLLCDAFIKLKQQPGFSQVRLRVSGGSTGDDRKFIRKQIKKLNAANLLSDVEFVEDYSKAQLKNFFDGLSLLSVPVLKGEAFGLYQLESLASGIPLVQPALGAFPEIIRQTGGGLTYQPNTPEMLAQKWMELLGDSEKLTTLSQNGHQAVKDRFDLTVQTEKIIAVYRHLTRVVAR
jgi:glycosyltransferase involved in cell wall biosynthesis